MWANDNKSIKTHTFDYVPTGKLLYHLDFDTQCQLDKYEIVLLQLMLDDVRIQTKFAPNTQDWSTDDPFEAFGQPDPPKAVTLWPLQAATATLVATAYSSLKLPGLNANGGMPDEKLDPWLPEDAVNGQFSVARRAVMGIGQFMPPFDNTKIGYPADEGVLTSFTWEVGDKATKWLADIQGTLRGDVRGRASPHWLNMRSPYMVVSYPPMGTLRFSISCFSRLHGQEIPFRANCSYALWGWQK